MSATAQSEQEVEQAAAAAAPESEQEAEQAPAAAE
jgi:hypothetical protein